MADFKEYTMSGGTVGPVDEAQLDALVGRYEWFTPARIPVSYTHLTLPTKA